MVDPCLQDDDELVFEVTKQDVVGPRRDSDLKIAWGLVWGLRILKTSRVSDLGIHLDHKNVMKSQEVNEAVPAILQSLSV